MASCNKSLSVKDEMVNQELKKKTPEPSKLTNDEKTNVMMTVIDMLLKSGLPNMNLNIACGIAGNIQVESSGFNYTAIGDHGTSYGLCQWHNNRWGNLYGYCEQIGVSPNTPEGQVKFLVYELNTDYAPVYETISSPEYANDIDKIATYFCKNFEIPANKDTVCPKRAQNARNVLKKYKEIKGQQ